LLIVVPFGVVFAAYNALQAVSLPETVAGALFASGEGIFHFLVLKLIEIIELVLVVAIGFGAGWGALKLIGLPWRLIGGGIHDTWRWLEARFYDHRVWMMMTGYFALILTILLFMNVPPQF